jgi:hypothetical protein
MRRGISLVQNEIKHCSVADRFHGKLRHNDSNGPVGKHAPGICERGGPLERLVGGCHGPRSRQIHVLIQNKVLLVGLSLDLEAAALSRSSDRVCVAQVLLDGRLVHGTFRGWGSRMDFTAHLLPFEEIRGTEATVDGAAREPAIALRHGGGPNLRTGESYQSSG